MYQPPCLDSVADHRPDASAGCAGLPGHDPLKVTVAGIEPVQGQGTEMRMMVKLGTKYERSPIDFSGVALDMEVPARASPAGQR